MVQRQIQDHCGCCIVLATEDIVKHTTNIIFSDGDKDPWHVGGVPFNATNYDNIAFPSILKIVLIIRFEIL